MVIGAFTSRFWKDVNAQSRYFAVYKHVSMQVLALTVEWAGVGLVIWGRCWTSL